MSRKLKIATENATAGIDPDLQLIDGPMLLQRLFPEQCRPTLRWLQTQNRQRTIPSTKIGHLRFYVTAAVRTALASRTVGSGGGK